MTDFILRKVVVGGEGKQKPKIFSIDNIEKNTITIVQISGEKYAEMESWLTSHEATIIGYHNALEFCPVYKVTKEIKLLFILRWS
jgi:hypothetical protein